MLFAPVALGLPDVVAEPEPDVHDARIRATPTNALVETARRNAPSNIHGPSLVVRIDRPVGRKDMATRARVRRHRSAAPPDLCRQRPENDPPCRPDRRDPDRLWHPPTGG